MTQDEIRAIAHKIAKEVFGFTELSDEGKRVYEHFATRFLAAITAKAEPVAEVRSISTGMKTLHWKYVGAEWSSLPVLTKLFTHPSIEPAGEVVVTTTEEGRCVCVTRQDEEGRILKVLWEAPAIEPAQQEPLGVTEGTATPAGAAPLPDEVREIVERLRIRTGSWMVAEQLRIEAADMIERLARQVPEGCVVVQRTVTEDAKCVMATPGNYRTYQDQWAALIAAGEVKP